jgi:hypothetical protein
MTDSDRLAHLRLAQSKIVARLDDPATPAYSIAPLANQLRLVEDQMARLTARDNDDEGLPDPEMFGFVTALGYSSWLRGPSIPARRRPVNDYATREREIFQSWHDAGFELSPKPTPTGDDVADRAAVDVWLEDQRVELIRCLDKNISRRESPEIVKGNQK